MLLSGVFSFGQTWTEIPFTLGGGTGSFSMCSGAITASITDGFVTTNGTTGEVNLTTGANGVGVIDFSQPIDIRITDRTSGGSNNGDEWDVVISPSSGWTSSGAEIVSTSASTLSLNLTSTGSRIEAVANSSITSITYNKPDGGGGGLLMFFDGDICPILLPVDFLDMGLIYNKEGQLEIKWITKKEIYNDYFTIEQSIDGIDWFPITKVKGAGNSSQNITYSYLQKRPKNGLNYYRIKQTDLSGEISYSKPRSIMINPSPLKIYPNPSKGLFKVYGASSLDKLKVYNSLGQDISNFVKMSYENDSEVMLDLTAMPKGSYFLKGNNSSELLIYD